MWGANGLLRSPLWYCNFGNGTTHRLLRRDRAAAEHGGGGWCHCGGNSLRLRLAASGCFVCIVAGTTANITDATWVLTRGAKTTDGTATWQECTGASAVNGDLTNTATWTTGQGNRRRRRSGAIIKRNNGASYQICTTAGTHGRIRAGLFSDTAGTTQTDGTTTWTSLGVVGNFTGGQAPHARLGQCLRIKLVCRWQHDLCRRQSRRVAGDGDHDCSPLAAPRPSARYFATIIPAAIRLQPAI